MQHPRMAAFLFRHGLELLPLTSPEEEQRCDAALRDYSYYFVGIYTPAMGFEVFRGDLEHMRQQIALSPQARKTLFPGELN